MDKTLKIIALSSYSFIILMGETIGLPLIFWLLFTSFDFGGADQPFALFGLVGLLLNFTKYGKLRGMKVLSFILMLLPLGRRLTAIPLEKYTYLAFQVPLFLFIISYLLYSIQSNQSAK